MLLGYPEEASCCRLASRWEFYAVKHLPLRLGSFEVRPEDLIHRVRLFNLASVVLLLGSPMFVLLTGLGLGHPKVPGWLVRLLGPLLLASPIVLLVGLILAWRALRQWRKAEALDDLQGLRRVLRLSASGPVFSLFVFVCCYVLLPFFME